MRSFILVGGLACVAGVLFVKGYLLKPASATGNSEADTGTEIRFKYTSYADERPRALPMRPQTQPQDQAAPDPQKHARVSTPEGGGPPPSSDDSSSSSASDPQSPGRDVRDVQAPDSDASGPHADAGPDRVVWMGDREIRLDGSASQGESLSYLWRQLDGPVNLHIKTPRVAQTTAGGLPQEWPDTSATYLFELTVRDAHGQEAVDEVSVSVQAAPALTVVPAATRRLAWREGYLLAHFEAWKTNRTDDAEAFEIRSPGELTFHHLDGTAEFELTPFECDAGFAYQLSLFYREPQSSSYVEFFVESAERIPAILQFGVNWE